MQLPGAGGCGRASLRRRPRGPRPVRPRARCGRLLPPSSRVFVCGGVGGERESAPRCRVPAPSQGGWGPLRATRRRRRLARTPVARAARTAPGAPPPPAAARTCPSRSPASKQRRPPAPRPRAPAPAPSLLPGRAPRPRHEERAMIPANASARKGPEGKYPLHYLVWYNRHRELEKEVRAGQVGALSGRRGDPTARHARPARGGGAARAVPPPRRVCGASLFAAAAFVLVDRERVMGAGPAHSPLAGTGGTTCVSNPPGWG